MSLQVDMHGEKKLFILFPAMVQEVFLLRKVSSTKPINFLFRSFTAGAPESDKKDLLSELEVMKTLKPHPHVIKLMGCVTQSGKLSVHIVPFNYIN